MNHARQVAASDRWIAIFIVLLGAAGCHLQASEPVGPRDESQASSIDRDGKNTQTRRPDGTGTVDVSGELKQWHKVTFTLDGPFAHELDHQPNPFTDIRFDVVVTHESGSPRYRIPGYFAADGEAAETSSVSGTCWRAHLSADKTGRWDYVTEIYRFPNAAIISPNELETPSSIKGALSQFNKSGSFVVKPSDKSARDFRSHGRLQYQGRRYLRFAGSGEYFLKAGADSPETLLAYVDFDGTVAGKPKKAPLKTYSRHLRDWRAGDPTWQSGKGKGLIGAINYLSEKGCNAFSFLPYNAGGDGDNVWPFVSRDDKLHYDCSKLDQWRIVLEHGTNRGMYLHFKMQETENDDNRAAGKPRKSNVQVRESLDGGDLGVQRKLYCRELIARFGHALALNWNLGEENTQSFEQQTAMIDYISEVDPYDHPIVVHTFPNQQDAVYGKLIGNRSKLTGVSLQNDGIEKTHRDTLRWVERSTAAGKPWVVAFDESGTAAHGQCPDLGYQDFDGHDSDGDLIYNEHDVRRKTLWGTLMAGGAGVEYYFGYKFVENDLLCEDWRSRDRSWDYCRFALNFFQGQHIPFWDMFSNDQLVGVSAADAERNNERFCFAKIDQIYLVYLATGKTTKLDLSDASGLFTVRWFNPRVGGESVKGSVATVAGGDWVSIGNPPSDLNEDWLAIISR
ncbi:MAG: DUF5060 domain-containing protein [Pirellulaceae bacterium]